MRAFLIGMGRERPLRVLALDRFIVRARPAPGAASSSASRLCVRYWPCLGVWPLLVALTVALPIALWARRDAPFPSSVMCTTAFQVAVKDGKRIDASCTALDSRAIRGWTPLPCSALSAALVALLDPPNALHRPLVYAIENDTGGRGAVTPFAAMNASGGIDGATARALLLGCAEGPTRASAPSSTQVMVLDRDYERSALVLALFLGVALAAGLRRRVTLDVDPADGLVLVVERGFVRERRTLLLAAADVADVVVVAGAAGFLSGRRVEVVLRDGVHAPLVESYAPLTFAVHEQAARRIRAYLRGADLCRSTARAKAM
jgi:hypothetical protein